MGMTRFLTRTYSLLSVSLLMESWRDADACRSVTGLAETVRDVEYARSIWWLDDTWIEQVCRNYSNAEPAVFQAFLRCGQEVGLALSRVARERYAECAERPESPPSMFLKDFIAWEDCFRRNAAFILVTHPVAKAVERRLLDILRHYGVPAGQLDQALLDLSVTHRSNGAEEENFDLFFIQRQRGRAGFDLDAALAEHTRKHAYLKYREPFSGGYTPDDFRLRLQDDLTLPDYFLPYAEIVERFRDEEKVWVELQDAFVFYRTFRTERSYEALYYLELGLTALEEIQGLSRHELSYCTRAELLRFLQSGTRVDPSLIEERHRDFAVLLHEGCVTVLSGAVAADWNRARDLEQNQSLEAVRGLTAYRGAAAGRARIVMSAADQDRVRAGDILIVPMTTPDYLPSLHKAAAFVTDEGGVICHAAIVARELKKPCVIGTRRATSVFRDGDWVEVDGFNGVVRLVQRP